MVKKLAFITATYFANKEHFSKDKVNIYVYGFELLISIVFNALGMFILALVMGIVFETLLFSLAFILMRSVAGGYHAKHHWSCFLTSIIVFSLFATLLGLFREHAVLSYVVFSTLISSLLFWLFAPIEAPNNPINESKKEKLREQSIFVAAINLTLTFIFVLLELPMICLAFYQSGALAASLSLLAAIAITQS